MALEFHPDWFTDDPAAIPAIQARARRNCDELWRQIEGQLEAGDRVVLIEDTMTSGRSTMAAVEAVRAEGCSVAKVITVVDRQQGGADLYNAEGIPFEVLVTLSDITAA